VGDDAGDCPTGGRVLGGKGQPTLEKTSPAVSRKRALPAKHIAKNFRIDNRVNASFSAKDSGFT
jgi:hypothetical protein